MNVIVIVLLVALLLGNFLVVYNLTEKLERVEQTLVDIEIIYMKLQQLFRGSQ